MSLIRRFQLPAEDVYTILASNTDVKGAKGASAPGGTVQGAAFGGAKIWNSEIWPLLANWRHNFIPTQTRAESVSSSCFLAVASDQPKFHCIM